MISNKHIYPEQVLALGRLYEFCSNKRFHLIRNEFLNDSIGSKALEINDQIKTQTGIDIFEATEDKDLTEYESTLNMFTSVWANKIFDSTEIGDELELIKWKSEYPPEKIIPFNIGVNNYFKSELKKLNLIIPDIVRICKSADSVVFIKEIYSFFLTKKINIKHKEKIILVHLSLYEPDQIAETELSSINYLSSSDLNSTINNSTINNSTINNSTINNLTVRMFLHFNYDEYSYLLKDPIRLFIKGLDMFGAKIPINNVAKKLHIKTLLPLHLRTPKEVEIFFHEQMNRAIDNKNLIFSSIFINGMLGKVILYLYAINFNKM